MFAIIQSGGRQLRVETGDRVTVDRQPSQPGDDIAFEHVLLVADGEDCRVGTPYVEGSRVTGVVDGEALGPKIRVFRRKRRKGMRRTTGHRTHATRVRITGIETS